MFSLGIARHRHQEKLMIRPLHFTKRALEKLPPAQEGRRDYYQDTGSDGLLIGITDRGAKSFRVRRKLNGKSIRVTLGRFPDMTIDQARRKAREALSTLAEGINPVAEKRASRSRAMTLGGVFEDYIGSRGQSLKPSTAADYRRVLNCYLLDWIDRPMTDIGRDAVERRHRRISERSLAQANYAMRLLRALFNFAMARYEDGNGCPILTDNPTLRLSGVKAWHVIDRRQTVIKPHQLPVWWAAVDALDSDQATAKASVVRDYLRFLLLTGLRRGEAARLRWVDVDLTAGTFTIPDPKNRERHTLPLSDYLAELLRRRQNDGSPFVFPGGPKRDTGKPGYIVEPRRWLHQVTRDSGVAFTIHDLRRTFATVAESLDISPYTLKRLLNHKSGADVTAGYLIIDTERLRDPMQRITDYILRAAGAKPTAAVIPLVQIRERTP